MAHGRLNRAAAALGLSESAVSHHLRKLEHTLGAQLLERGGVSVVLTPAGERFAPLARDAVARLELSDPVRRALENGVDLHITWEVDIERYRGWWLNAEVASVVQRYRLAYHALSLQYIATNLNTGERRSFTRLPAALDHIGMLIGFPLVDRMLIGDPGRHRGYARVRLDHGELPLPLRPTALFSADWDLASDWRPWRFE